MVPIMMRTKAMTAKTAPTSLLLSSLQSRPYFAFHRSLSNLLGRNTRRGEERASPSIPSPFRSPKRAGIRTRKPLGTSLISLPRMKSDGESRSRHECFEKHVLRKQTIRTRRFLVKERGSLLDTSIWTLGQRNRIRAQRITHMCVLTFVLAFGRFTDSWRVAIQCSSGRYSRQDSYH